MIPNEQIRQLVLMEKEANIYSFPFYNDVPSDYIHNVSLPVQLQCEATGSSSSEHGSMSPDCDSKHDVFFQKKKNSGSENLLKPPNSNYLRWVSSFDSSGYVRSIMPA